VPFFSTVLKRDTVPFWPKKNRRKNPSDLFLGFRQIGDVTAIVGVRKRVADRQEMRWQKGWLTAKAKKDHFFHGNYYGNEKRSPAAARYQHDQVYESAGERI